MPTINICEPPSYPVFGDNSDSDWIVSGIDMYSGVSGNVGIGTPSPQEKLEVAGTIRQTGFQLTTGAVTGYVLKSFDANGVGVWGEVSLDELSDVILTAPANGEVLQYNGSEWVNASIGATVGGSDTEVQFNNSGVLDGDSKFVYNVTDGKVGIGGIVAPDRDLYVSYSSNTIAFDEIPHIHIRNENAVLGNFGSTYNSSLLTIEAGSVISRIESSYDDSYSGMLIYTSSNHPITFVLNRATSPLIPMSMETTGQINMAYSGAEVGTLVIGDLGLAGKEILRVIDTFGVNALYVQQRTSGRIVGINTDAPQSTLDVAGSQSVAYRGVSSSTSLTDLDYILGCDATTSYAINLPDIADSVKRVYSVLITTGTGTITLVPFGGNLIDGAGALTLNASFRKSVVICNDGSNNWFILAKN